jgi:hypothetical protein
MNTFFDEALVNWRKHWRSMPEFIQDSDAASPYKSIIVHFSDAADVSDFEEKIGQKVTESTKYIYHPKQQKENLLSKKCIGKGNPRFPVFIPTKGRWEHRYTIKMFERLGIPYKAVIEKQEYEQYAAVIPKENIIVLPHQNKGLTVTRNWIWKYAKEQGYEYFWTFDDNIKDIYRLNRNMKYRCDSGIPLYIIEEFAMRYTNLYITGMQYEMFVPRKTKVPPYIANTRVYSNMLIKTNIPFRNKLFYNDDTDLCLQVLKSGFCTVLFQAFLIDKQATMIQKGGMTDFYEKTNNRREFAEELQRAHPDVVTITKKFNRWHHQVDYSPFKANKLILKEDVVIPDIVNEFGLKIIK